MTTLRLVPFTPGHVPALEPWFDDPETMLRLGDRSWIRRAPALLELPTGAQFRGRITTGRRMWVSVDDRDTPVGFVDGEMYDRYTAWDASDPDSPVISDAIDVPSMGLVWVVDPPQRRQGMGRATIRAVVEHADLRSIGLFFAEIDADNVASMRCAEAAGFRCRKPSPNFEGMVCYSLERDEHRPPERVAGDDS
jgi:RimJ/RimL family protein N-acetyltransferase